MSSRVCRVIYQVGYVQIQTIAAFEVEISSSPDSVLPEGGDDQCVIYRWKTQGLECMGSLAIGPLGIFLWRGQIKNPNYFCVLKLQFFFKSAMLILQLSMSIFYLWLFSLIL